MFFSLFVETTAAYLKESYVGFAENKNCTLPPLLGYVCNVVLDAMVGLISLVLSANQIEANVPVPEKSAQKKAASTVDAVLGKDIMEAVWADMALTILPSWVTDVPCNWGTTTQGKLSANNWRVICMVHLPITLIRLWGGGDAPTDQKNKLENFMDLVRAVQIANLHSISNKEIELHEYYIFCYVTMFKSLYKLAKVKPIHHAALHYGDVLRGFGPAHTHSAAFYKRYIHFMQSKNHNMKLGS